MLSVRTPCAELILVCFLTEAALASSVKIAGRDVLATWKLLVALVVVPLLYGFYAFVLLCSSISNGWLVEWTFFKALAFFLLTFLFLAVGSYMTLRLFDTGLDVYRSVFMYFCRCHARLTQSLA
jgi:glycerol-3-phosphate O-acyltransferase/dihydroxyacetone phosphate acyltransferase